MGYTYIAIQLDSLMVGFLSESQEKTIMRMFTSDSVISGQLRRIFGSSQAVAGGRVNYPAVIQRSSGQTVRSPAKIRPSVRYPRSIRTSPDRSNQIQIHRPGRRPLQAIRGDSGLWSHCSQPEDKSKDRTAEKIRLQELLQFSSTGILPQNRPKCTELAVPKARASKISSAQANKDIMSQLISEIAESQAILENQKSITNEEKTETRNRIRRGIRELKLMSELMWNDSSSPHTVYGIFIHKFHRYSAKKFFE